MRQMLRPVPGRGPAARLAVVLATVAGLVWTTAAAAGAAPAERGAATPDRVPLTAAAAAAQGVGATTPFTTYEAEAGTLGGGAQAVTLTSAPTTQYSSAALEASGHGYVHLAGTGQSVRWTNTTGQPISFVNVRASIPDSASGGGITATLDLYVDGVFRQALNLNSKQTWVYEGTNYNNSDDQNPAEGDPRVFFDESHTFVAGSPIAPGSTLTLQKDAANTASSYDVDAIDVENPPAALTQPAGSISITSCGAVADNTPTNGAADPQSTDSRAAIQNCIDQAQSQGKTLWIPQGTFYVKGTAGLNAQGITIAGAGMWYSTIYRDVPVPNSTPLPALFGLTSTHVQNFHIDANAVSRSTIGGDGGAMDTTGTNWSADGIWTQHTESGFWASGTGGTVRNCRLTAIWADGINVNNVSLGASSGNDLTVTNNFVRGTGDDAIAINSVNYNTNGDGSKTFYNPMTDITVTNNTSIAPWGGKGVAVYGGSGHVVENNYISDTARYIGLGAGRFGVNGSDLLSATISGNTVVRSGGNAYSQGQPALHIGNGGDGQNTGTVDHVSVTGNTVADSVYDAIGFSTSTNTLLQNNTVTGPGRNGIVISPPFYPAPTGSATITGNTVSGLKSGATAYANNSSGFTASLSGNSWQSGGTGPVEAPYGGTPAAVPGTVEAENYDTGGQGVAYNVNSVNGNGTAYRADGVDLEATSDTGGGYDLGWTSSGQWQRYTVNVATAGTYALALRVAAPSAVSGALHLADSSGANLSPSVSIPATGDWQTWSTVTTTVTLPAGRQVITLDQDNGGWNLNSFAFSTASGSTGTNLAAGKATSESSHTQTYASSAVTDGDRNSYWESANNSFPQWVQVDLGSARSVSRVVLQLPASWGARSQTLTLQAGTDPSTVTTTLKGSASYTFDPASGNTVTLTFPATTQRVLRVTVSANSGWPAGQLSEFQVWSA
ncbi:carbohydrate-binding protein [Actinacidiphila guanduensis]|uniref:Right handed beta helix region n=1 Tax=Actinacidiphila guanduensis TaxID=310781 RepID=A0A1G9V177_9ACTN|nr:carbohydrate-binding protein [Actinacidiphila guanduensis]SDM65820.1 Right handed beta helix region [Actinacidiphila guanduensis]